MQVCSAEKHEAIKRDPVAWAKLKLVGVQRFDDGGPSLELRNCPCGSTLGCEVAS